MNSFRRFFVATAAALAVVLTGSLPAPVAAADVIVVPPGNQFERQPRVDKGSRALTAMGGGSFKTKYDKVYKLLASDPNLIGGIKKVASIYGIDIDEANVLETQARIEHVVRAHYSNDANTSVSTAGFDTALTAIIQANIIRADFLVDAESIEFVDYQEKGRYRFQRYWSPMIESRPGDTETAEQRSLFDLGPTSTQTELFPRRPEPRSDPVPVHYSVIAAHRGPVPNPDAA